MKIPLHEIAQVLAKRSLKTGMTGANNKSFGREIAAYLLETGRVSELDSLMRELIAYRAKHGVVEVTALSARQLSADAQAEVRAEVKRLYTGAKQIIINERHDPDLVGGVRLELVDQQLDLSIRSTLNRFKALSTTERTA